MCNIVREHINEKFSEVSDPVEDMGIGVEGIVQEMRKQRKWNDYDIFRHELSEEKDIEKAKMIMNYLLKSKEVDFNNKYTAQDLFHTATRNEMRNFIVEKAIEYKAKAALAEFLIEASKWNDTELVTKLVNGGADPRIRGNKPIMLAIRHRNKKLWDLMEPYIKWKN